MNLHNSDTSVRGKLPSFIVFGATKCGTTSLFDWMTRHPDIFVHARKEMRFFLQEYRWKKGLDWYREQFAETGDALAWGEISNGYGRGADYPGAPAKIAATVPDVRLVYLIRDPMARLASHYRHRVVTGREWRRPAAAIRADRSYVETGRYGAELTRWLKYFDRAQILVLRSERIFDDPAGELSRLATHLEVPVRSDLRFRRENDARDRAVMPAPLRGVLGPLRAHRTAKRLARGLDRLPNGLLRRASDVSVELPGDLRAEIRKIYRADRDVLRGLVPQDDCNWRLE